jgi:isochorismate pyruvate lyase
MAEVRTGVDATDRELMALLDRRFGYMRAAARIKPERASVRDEARKAQVIANARADAHARALPADRIATLWNLLVETSIEYEFQEWDRQRD